jgi:hypothetical protein
MSAILEKALFSMKSMIIAYESVKFMTFPKGRSGNPGGHPKLPGRLWGIVVGWFGRRFNESGYQGVEEARKEDAPPTAPLLNDIGRPFADGIGRRRCISCPILGRQGIQAGDPAESGRSSGRNCRQCPEEPAAFPSGQNSPFERSKNNQVNSNGCRQAPQLARGLPYLLTKDPKRASSIPRDGSPPARKGRQRRIGF